MGSNGPVNCIELVSFLLFDAVIKCIFSQPVRLAFMVLYWLNPWLLYDSLMYNPSYLCFFTALHFWSAFKMRHQASFIYSFLHVVAIGGTMQLHYSWPVLAVMSMYLFYRRMIHISWVGAISGGLAIVASLIPYLQEYMANDSISRESDRYIGYGAVHVYPVLKAVLYWLRYGSTLFSNRIITDASFDWLTTVSWLQMVIQYCWQAVLFVVGAITVVVSAKLNWKYWKVIKPTIKRQHVIEDDTHWLLLFALATVIGIIVSAMLSPITFSYWHLILTYPLALIPLLVKAQSWQQKKPERFTQLLLGLAGFFLIINLVASHDSDKYSYKVNYADQVESRLIDIGLQPQQ
ncbi:3-deoxy-D-manno-octulosonic acid transferase [Veronia nyctiphanis]|uniref:3-deoxy-D-manno-octulosonic acid transferase n=1 Tax=Veronia nyctiphanis TaxID=1278244 RepID=UPI001F3F17BE|nr:3-deoxy-D-manno-octulosonic acid transferase [Veronia nyctiphanis]